MGSHFLISKTECGLKSLIPSHFSAKPQSTHRVSDRPMVISSSSHLFMLGVTFACFGWANPCQRIPIPADAEMSSGTKGEGAMLSTSLPVRTWKGCH